MKQLNILLNRSVTAERVRRLSRLDPERRLLDLDFCHAHSQPIESENFTNAATLSSF